MKTVLTKIYKNIPPLCVSEVMRYLGYKQPNESIEKTIVSCFEQIQNLITYKVCYGIFNVTKTNESTLDLTFTTTNSKDLIKTIKDSNKIIVFGATIGIEIDKIIAKYGIIELSTALVFQAIGTERIESLCNVFCQDISNQMQVNLTPRFSPGYGDLPLEIQKDIFNAIDCSRKIGLTLNNSLIMSPIKSVTGIMGITNLPCDNKNDCTFCKKTNCDYRKTL